jgi:hypothetical protein
MTKAETNTLLFVGALAGIWLWSRKPIGMGVPGQAFLPPPTPGPRWQKRDVQRFRERRLRSWYDVGPDEPKAAYLPPPTRMPGSVQSYWLNPQHGAHGQVLPPPTTRKMRRAGWRIR